MIGYLHVMAFMMLVLVGWVIWNHKPLTIDHLWTRQPAENSCFSFGNTALQPTRPVGPPFSVIQFQWEIVFTIAFVFTIFSVFLCLSFAPFCYFFCFYILFKDILNHTKFLQLNSIHWSVRIGMRFHLYIFFTTPCSLYVCSLNCAYLIFYCCFSTFQKVINRVGWLDQGFSNHRDSIWGREMQFWVAKQIGLTNEI